VSWRLAAPHVVTPDRGDPVSGDLERDLERERRRYHRSHIYAVTAVLLPIAAVLIAGCWLL